MTSQEHPEEHLGRLDDEAEAQEPSDTREGPAAAGEYDPAQGSPHRPHQRTHEGMDEETTGDDADAGG